MIGIIGFDCSRFSFRRIVEFWLSKQSDNWDHTSVILAMLHNVHATKSKDATEFHPFVKQQKKNLFTTADIGILKGVFQ